MAKGKTLTGKTVNIEVIKSSPRTNKSKVKYRITDGRGNSKIVTGERAEDIDRRTR